MSQSCRICLSQLKNSSTDLNEIRENLPISVIAMILLPIKITENDSLSQKICKKCLEILLNTMKLRDVAVNSDRILRAQQEVEFNIKNEEEETFLAYEPPSSPEFTTFTESPGEIQQQGIYEIQEIFADDLKVDLFKKHGIRNSSKVWEYFGRLLNGNDEIAGSQDFHYCSLCLQVKKIVKYRKTSATSSLYKHLELVHGISKNGENIEGVRNDKDFKQPKKRKVEGGAATICSECGKNFSCWTILKRHMKIHGEKAFECSRCPSKFAFKENLHRHERTHDQNHFQRYICDNCGSGFAEIKSLKSHLLKIHLNIQSEKNFHCPYESCSMSFERKFNLNKHLMTHCDYKPHSCNYCSAAYASKGDLFKHLQKLHVGDALWNCEYCQASFRLKAELQRHYNVHYEPIEEKF